MGWARRALVAGALAVSGAGVTWMAPPHLWPWSAIGGVALCVLAFDVAVRLVLEFNNADTRAVYAATGFMLGAALYRASGSYTLGAAPVALALLTMSGELMIRSFGYHSYKAYFVAVLISASLAVAQLSWWSAAMILPVGFFVKSFPLLADGIKRFRSQNRGKWAVKVGEPVPEFALPQSGSGEVWRLSDHRGKHVLIQLSRGDWCPVCHVMMRVLKREAEKMQKSDIVVVMISSTEGADAEEFVRELGLPYCILRDPKCETAKAYGAFDTTAFGGKGGNLPATFVVAPDGTLALCSRSDDVASFLDPADVIRQLTRPTVA